MNINSHMRVLINAFLKDQTKQIVFMVEEILDLIDDMLVHNIESCFF